MRCEAMLKGAHMLCHDFKQNLPVKALAESVGDSNYRICFLYVDRFCMVGQHGFASTKSRGSHIEPLCTPQDCAAQRVRML